MREGSVERCTNETSISVRIDLDGTGKGEIHSGIGFFDHMLNLSAAHGLFDMKLQCNGDTEVDGHHSVEDIGIALGQAVKEALGDKKGIARYGSFYLPMDESLSFVALDISGRPFLVYDGGEMAPMIGGYDTELTEEFRAGTERTLSDEAVKEKIDAITAMYEKAVEGVKQFVQEQ